MFFILGRESPHNTHSVTLRVRTELASLFWDRRVQIRFSIHLLSQRENILLTNQLRMVISFFLIEYTKNMELGAPVRCASKLYLSFLGVCLAILENEENNCIRDIFEILLENPMRHNVFSGIYRQ